MILAKDQKTREAVNACNVIKSPITPAAVNRTITHSRSMIGNFSIEVIAQTI
jgi:hypothetical protein